MVDRLVSLMALAFLLGSIPSGYLMGRLYGKDVRRWGSGKTGATNVLRTAGILPAVLTLVIDALKAFAAIWVADYLLGTGWGRVLAGSLAILGHIYSPFLGWRGGRGVIAALAAMAACCLPCALAVMAVGIAVVILSRYVSLASLTIATLMPLALLIWVLIVGGDPWLPAYGLIAGMMLWFSHRDNVQRLIRGTERKLGEGARPV